jgi:hypothetical protein
MMGDLDGWVTLKCECGVNIGLPCNLGGWGATVANRDSVLAYLIDHNGQPGHLLNLFVEGVDALLAARGMHVAGQGGSR